MKKLTPLVACVMLAGCGYASPDAGQEGVLVSKPWFFGSGGVDMEPVHTGSALVAASTDVVYVQVTPQAFTVEFDDLMPSNGIPLDFHATIRVQVTDSARLVRDWNGGAVDQNGNPSNIWFWGNIGPQFGNLVRSEVKNYDMAALAFSGAAIDEIDAKVFAKLADFIKRNNLPVKLLSVTIGRATPPKEILDQRTETAAQQQREQTMLAQQKAEEARKGAEAARANADNAYNREMGLTPGQYVDLKRIEMQRDACAKGTCIFGNATPMVSK